MKEIRLTGLAFKNFIRGLEQLGYEPKWNHTDADGSQYCAVTSSAGNVSEESIGQLRDAEELMLDGHIGLGHAVGFRSIQNTFRRWSTGTFSAFQKPTDSVVHPIDRLVAGLLILKRYAPEVSPDPCTRRGLSLMLQCERFESISEQDRTRLVELGWWTNGALVWAC